MTTKDAKPLARDLDRRVRDRNLATGKLEPKTVEKYLADLPDLEGHLDTMVIPQPAIGDAANDDAEP